MGLLDVLNTEQGRLGLGLLAAGGARSDGANFGQRMQEGIGSVDQWKAQQQLSQQRQMQIDEAKRQQDDAIAMREMAARFKTPAQPGRPAIPAAPEFGIPTALSAVEAKPEGYDYQGFANAMAERNPQASWSMLQAIAPKAPEAYTLGEGQTRYEGGKPIASGPAKPMDANKPFYLDKDGRVMPNEAYQAFDLKAKAAGASSVNVPINMGQKGLDNTLKVRSDFRSEPIYKAHGEVQSAHSQITTALKQNSPAGDLAGATKLMKILDPGSVVRESELGMAMAASGMLDRVQNYGNMILSGEKLTPLQRKDFQTLSDALLKESQGQYNAKREEYKGIADRNQLSVPDILGPEPKIEQKAATQPAGKVPMRGQVVQGYKFKGGNPADQSNWEKQ